MNNNTIKILSVVTTIAGLVLTAMSNWVSDKNMEVQIEEQVEAKLKEHEERKLGCSTAKDMI